MSAPQLLASAKDIEVWANTKLSGDWSAPGVVSQIDQAKLQLLGTVFSQGKLDQLVKVRLLIACMLLPKSKKEELAAELEELGRAATSDDDEWVRVMGCAVGGFSGQLDLDAVMRENAMVDESVKTLWAQLDAAQPPPSFMPLQEMYLHPDIRTLPQQHAPSSTSQQQQEEDFRPREQPPESGQQGGDQGGGLPDFSIESLHGGLPGQQGQLLSPRTGATSVHARRGTGLAGTGMFISSKAKPQTFRVPRVGQDEVP